MSRKTVQKLFALLLAGAMVLTSTPETVLATGVQQEAADDSAVVETEELDKYAENESGEGGSGTTEGENQGGDTTGGQTTGDETESGNQGGNTSGGHMESQLGTKPEDGSVEEIWDNGITSVSESDYTTTFGSWAGLPELKSVAMTACELKGDKIGSEVEGTYDADLYPVTGFTGFDTDKAHQSGYYMAYSLNLGGDAIKAIKKAANQDDPVVWLSGRVEGELGKTILAKEFKDQNEEGDNIVLLSRVADLGATEIEKEIKVKFDFDGTGDYYQPVTYILTPGKVTLHKFRSTAEVSKMSEANYKSETEFPSATWTGKPEYEKVSGVTIDFSESVANTERYTYSGKLEPVTGFTGFDPRIKDDQNGYYMAYTLHLDGTAVKAIQERATVSPNDPVEWMTGHDVSGNEIEKTFKAIDFKNENTTTGTDLNIITKVASLGEKPEAKTFRVALDFDGEGKAYEPVVYEFIPTELELVQKEAPALDLKDEDYGAAWYNEKIGNLNGAPEYRRTALAWEEEEGGYKAAKGQLTKTEEGKKFTDFSSKEEEQTGYYTAMDLKSLLDENVAETPVKVYDVDPATNKDAEPTNSFTLKSADTAFVKLLQEGQKAFYMVVDPDGDEWVYKPTTYKFDLSDVTYADAIKSEIKISAASEGEYGKIIEGLNLGDDAPDYEKTVLDWGDDPVGNVYKPTGELLKVTGFTSFNTAKPEEQEGYYASIKIEAPKLDQAVIANVAADKVVGTVKTFDKDGKELHTKDQKAGLYQKDDGFDAALILKWIPENAEKITITIDWDGEDGKLYSASTYTLDLSGIEKSKAWTSKISGDVSVMPEEAWNDNRNPVKVGRPDWDDVNLGNGEAIFKPTTVTKDESGNNLSEVELRGSLNFVTGFTDFNTAAADEQEGYYAALMIPMPFSAIQKTLANTNIGDNDVIFSINGKNWTKKDMSGWTQFDAPGLIYYNHTQLIGKCSAKNWKDASGNDILRVYEAKDFTLTVDWDGPNGTDYDPTTYTFKVDKIRFNDEEKYSEAKELPEENSYDINRDGNWLDIRGNQEENKTIEYFGKLWESDQSKYYPEYKEKDYFIGFTIMPPKALEKVLTDDSKVVISYKDKTTDGKWVDKYLTWKAVKDEGENVLSQLIHINDDLIDAPANSEICQIKIRWMDYSEETYAVKFGDYVKVEGAAVAPAKLALQAYAKTMYVGGEQQINPTITKAKSNDVIKLAYDVVSSDAKKQTDAQAKEVLKVDETGKITALKAGSATVTVTAVNRAGTPFVDAKKKPIQVSMKLTVKELDAVKGMTVSAVSDKTATVKWTDANGQAADVYVLTQSKIKDVWDASKREIKLLQDDARIMEHIEVEYADDGKEVYDLMAKASKELAPNTKYTVLVVNKASADGENAYVSKNAAVKDFTTSKELPTDIEFVGDSEITLDYDAKKPSVEARLLWGEEKSTTAPRDKANVTISYGSSDTSVVKVNAKSGALTLQKKAGTAYIMAKAAVPRVEGGYITTWKKVTVTADPKTAKAKTTNFVVGQTIALRDLLTYDVYNEDVTMGEDTIKYLESLGVGTVNKKPTAVVDPDGDLERVFDIDRGDGTITALHEVNGNIVINQGDLHPEYDGEEIAVAKGAKATITVKALVAPTAPKLLVDGGKKSVSHDWFKVAFQPGKGSYATDYEIKLLAKDKKTVEGRDWINEDGLEDPYHTSIGTYVDSKWNWYYTCEFGDLQENTTYFVSVIAHYENAVSKEVFSGKINTTKRVAEAYDRQLADKFSVRYVSSVRNDKVEKENDDRIEMVSGGWSVYVGDMILVSAEVDPLVRGLETDSLVWKVTGEKGVVTQKVNKSTFDMALTANKAGRVTVEVKSKTTGKVYGEFVVVVQPYENQK